MEQKILLTGASSHNASTEKQFRYPTEYGGQKPPTAQWTVTGAGVALVTTNIGPRESSFYNICHNRESSGYGID